MPIIMAQKHIVPTTRIILSHSDDEYSLPLSVLQEQFLTEADEEVMQAMARYKPATKIKAGDFVFLTEVPSWLQYRGEVPRCWKIRFVLTEYAWNLMRVVTHYGSSIGLDRAVALLENHRMMDPKRYRKPMIYGTGFPKGKNEDTAAWLPEPYLQRTIFREPEMDWRDIVTLSGADYLGYLESEFPSRYTLDWAPSNYKQGNNIGHPFPPEEPLVNTLYFSGLEEMVEVPFKIGEEDRVARIDQDHDIFATDD